jgi:hypothetical protein
MRITFLLLFLGGPALAQIATQPTVFDSVELGPCLTIDHSNNDGGVLEQFRKSLGSPPQHSCVLEAVSNLLDCQKGGPDPAGMAIVGHGSSGSIVVGTGILYEYDTHLAEANAAFWTGHVETLQDKVDLLTLLSCHTARGNTGRNLLCGLAAATGGTVRARTGLVTSDSDGVIYLQAGTSWRSFHWQADKCVEATPPPADPEVPPASYFLWLGRRIPLSRVSSIDFFDLQLRDGKAHQTQEGDAARRLLEMIGFVRPFQMPGEPLAIATFDLAITFDGTGPRQTARFRVYNNLVVRDMSSPSQYYEIQPALADILRNLSASVAGHD